MKTRTVLLLLAAFLAVLILQYQEQRRTTEAIQVLTEIFCEVTDAQDCDREEVEDELQAI